MKKISRAKAKSLGLSTYFTGQSCIRGHICERFVVSNNCKLCCKAIRIEVMNNGKCAQLCGRSRDGQKQLCSVCISKRIDYNLKRRYGISLKDYNIKLKKQKGKCAICCSKSRSGKGALHVDHNHITKQVRGLLCDWCNRKLGTVELLLNAGIIKEINHKSDMGKYLKCWA
jgi:hypothetical protein